MISDFVYKINYVMIYICERKAHGVGSEFKMIFCVIPHWTKQALMFIRIEDTNTAILEFLFQKSAK